MGHPAVRARAPRGQVLRGQVLRGRPRLLRGWAAAVVATVLAAGSHTLAGGQAPTHDAGPHPLVWILTLALAAPLCTALAGRALSWWRLLGAVGSSQLLFHWLYSVEVVPSGRPATPGATAAHAGHAAHASRALETRPAGGAAPGGLPGSPVGSPGPLVPPLEPGAVLPAEHASAGMLAAHVLAAVVTVLLLRRGERLTARVVELAAGLVLRAPGARLAHWTPAVRVPRVPSRPLVPVTGPGAVVVFGLRLRGPPASAFA